MKKIRTLIVDDEPLAREGLAILLAADSAFELIGTCADGQSAIAAIRAQAPDLVFLDVQMPKLDGFQVLAELKTKERPLVIFVTAYDEYAVRAFEFSAVDYLLKPFRDARFAASLVRAKHEIRQARTTELDQRVEQLLGYVRDLTRDGAPPAPVAPAGPEYADRIVLKTGSDLHFIKTQDVIWIEAQGDFVKVQTTGQAQLVRETLQSMTDKLDTAKFFRIHRSFLVNLEHVRKVTPALYGDYTVLMSDGSKLRLSRNYRGKLKALIAQLPAA
jgi:two-component system, LytTR family, response regulator